MKLRHKTIVLLVPLIIIPILTVGFVSFNKLYKTEENRLTTHVVTLLDQISRHTINSEQVAKANLEILAEHPLVKKYSLTSDEVIRYEILLPSLLDLFENLQKNMPNYLEIKFITPQGFEDAYWNKIGVNNINENISDEWYFKEIQNIKGSNECFIIFDENNNEYALLVVRKILIRDTATDAYGSQPKLRGYLSILLSLENLKHEINKNKIGKSGFLAVFNTSGKSILIPENRNNEEIKSLSSVLSSDLALDEGKQYSSIKVQENLILSFSRDLVSDIKITGILPEKDLISDSYELGRTVMVITVFAIIIAVLLFLASLHYLIMQPLDVLTQAATKIKNGELDVNIDIHQNDEMGALASSFVDMSKTLKSTHEILRVSHQRLMLHREHSPLAVIEWNVNFELLDWNPAAENIFGYRKDEVIGLNITDNIFPDGAQEMVNAIWQELLDNNEGTHNIYKNITKDEQTILCEWYNTPLVDDDGSIIGIASLVEDITQQQKTEERLRQTQKMDAIGKLTGGIAHDFNNMLGVILGFSELLKLSLSKDSTEQNQYCDEITIAGERAKKLTSQLLEYSRKAPSVETDTDVNELLSNMQNMLEKTLTPRIKLTYKLEDEIWLVMLDRSRTENAILNICINAMQAMPDVGELTISTSTLTLDDSNVQEIGATPGDYVLISLCDTGVGMSQDIQDKIFDPFFTTRGTEGTGLGLSQVHGFVEQFGGKVHVSSGLDKGTCIDIYIPRLFHEVDNSEIINEDDKFEEIGDAPSGNETILLVDDEEVLLEYSELILSEYGYTIITAESAKEALELLKKNQVDLMITDVIMPEMDGYQLVAEVTKLYPKIKIQILSGFSDESKSNLISDSLYKNRLHKPVSSNKLLLTIRNLLDEGK